MHERVKYGEGPKPRPYLNNNNLLTPVAGPAARWKPWWWRTAALGRPLEELLDLWAQTDWAQADCRVQGHERPGLRLSVPAGWCSIVSSPRNSQSMVQQHNLPTRQPRHRSARALLRPIPPQARRRLHVPRPSLQKISAQERAPHSRLSFSCEFPPLCRTTQNTIQAAHLADRV